jgi:hypothetical protein
VDCLGVDNGLFHLMLLGVWGNKVFCLSGYLGTPLPNKRAGELKNGAESNRRAFALAGIGNSSIA